MLVDKNAKEIEAVATSIVDGSVRVHRELGAGLLESVYQTCIAYELRQRGHEVDCELLLPLRYHDALIETGFRIDMLIDGQMVIENKSVQAVLPIHEAQLLTYLKLSGMARISDQLERPFD